MGLTDLFTKLIVEHGSAVVQEKHIALFRDQLITADKKSALLESENGSLKTTVEQLTKKNEILRRKIQEYKQSSHDNLLDDIKVKILLFMTRYEEVYVQNVAKNLEIGLQTAQFHLDELCDNEFVSYSLVIGESTTYFLDHGGRKYLVENGLIS